MKILVATALAIGIAAPVQAALSPYGESVRLIKGILDNQQVAEQLGSGQTVQSVERLGEGFGALEGIHYEVTTQDCTLRVVVRYQDEQSDRIGPRDFRVHVGEADCR